MEEFSQREWSARSETFLDLFQAQARIHPDSIAVICRDETLSYRDLELRSRKLTVHLKSIGIMLEDVVAIALDRSTETLVSILAVLRAGAIYLPLDLSHPAARIQYMLIDSRARCLISTQPIYDGLAQANEFVSSHDGQALMSWPKPCLLDDENIWKRSVDTRSQNVAHTDDLQPITAGQAAYLIYTSGSSGTPKAVIGTHAALHNRLQWILRDIPFAPDEVAMSRSSIAFVDGSTECLAPLCAGKTVHLLSEKERSDPITLSQLMLKYQNFRINLVPSLLPLFEFSASHLSQCQGTVIISGEHLSSDRLRSARLTFARCRLYNLYGMTECCGDSTMLQYDEKEPPYESIGFPIDHTQIYILDESLSAVGEDQIGEIYIAGLGLARGYHHRPGETAFRFVANPFNEPGSRMYRTGDLGQWNRDGSLRYVGRVDRQVNIKGIRIELAEIESELIGRFGMSQVTVQLRLMQGQSIIIAYWIAVEGAQLPTESAIRQALQKRLPAHMIPLRFVQLLVFPLNVNGKLDLMALPEPDVSESRVFSTPKTTEESMICRLYERLTGTSEIGREDYFSFLGADSLLIMRLITGIWQATGQRLEFKHFFDHPRVCDLALYLSSSLGLSMPLLSPASESRGLQRPLSNGQVRHWLLEQIDGRNSSYNLPATFRLNSSLNLDALGRAFVLLVERHEALRTVISQEAGDIRGYILPSPGVYQLLTFDNMPRVEGHYAEAGLNEKIFQFVNQTFDLKIDYLLRARLFSISEHDHVLAIVMHHSASDGISTNILLDELTKIYKAYQSGVDPELEPLAVTYSDFASWQHDLVTHSAEIPRQLAYWQSEFEQAPTFLDLPTDTVRRPNRSREAGYIPIFIDAQTVLRLSDLAQRHHTTLFTVLMAVYATLLGRLGSQQSVVIGFPVAGRLVPQVEKLVGFFVNTLPLLIEIKDQQTVNEFIDFVHAKLVNAMSHQDIPFDILVDRLAPNRALTHTPVFQAMFAWQGQSLPSSLLDEEQVQPISVALAQAKFDLTLTLDPGADGEVLGALEFDRSLFSEGSARSWVKQFEQLCEEFSSKPTTSLARLQVLGPEEIRTVTQSFNETYLIIADRSVIEWFEHQAKKTPNQIALTRGHEHMTYQELDFRANQIGHHLITQNIGAEDLVAVGLERSIDMVATILAILKTGASYLPLDIEYPNDRLLWMLKDSGAKHVVSTVKVAQALQLNVPRDLRSESEKPFLPIAMTLLDEASMQQVLAEADGSLITDHDRLRIAGPDHLAYLIYTSGSTGLPKAVEVQKRSLDNLVAWYVSALGLTKTDRCLLISAIGFDLTQKNIFAPLVSGGTLYLPASYALDFQSVISELESQAITYLNCTPSTFYALADLTALSSERAFNSLRWLVLGGEQIQSERLDFLASSGYFRAQVMNSYGPTECTDISTTYCFSPLMAPQRIPLGKPIHNVKQYVLNETLEPSPIGSIGELYISGVSLARGYRGRPRLTAQAFIANPFEQEGSRMYRTGDLARWHHDGTVEYIGRIDNQIKFCGFRIETAEVEAEIRRHIDVVSVTVQLREVFGQQRLIAYLVPARSCNDSDINSLRKELGRFLPRHMIPGSFLVLKSLPITPNGKVDWKALPLPESEPKLASRKPESQRERLIANLFQQLTGTQFFGVEDSFFALGGDSIQAIRLVGLAREAGLDFGVRDVFAFPTVVELAKVATEFNVKKLSLCQPLAGDVPLTPIQTQYLKHAGPVDRFHNGIVLRIPSHLSKIDLEVALVALIAHHDALRLSVEGFDEPSLVLNPLSTKPLFDFLCIEATEAEDEQRLIERLMLTLPAKLSPALGKMLAAVWVEREDQSKILIVAIHHLAVDGISWRILVDDLFKLIDGRPLTERTHSVRDWAQYLHKEAFDPLYLAELPIWQNALIGTVSLPVDFSISQADNVEGDAAQYLSYLQAGPMRDLLSIAVSLGVGVDDLFLTALGFALYKWRHARYQISSGAMLVSLEGHGRETHGSGLDLSQTVGWFTSIYPVRIDWEGLDWQKTPIANDVVVKALGRIKSSLRQVVNRGLGFGLLRWLNPTTQKVLEPLPTAQISFNYLGRFNTKRPQNEQSRWSDEIFVDGPENAEQRRFHIIDITALVDARGRLQMRCRYSRSSYVAKNIEDLMSLFESELIAFSTMHTASR